MRGINFDSCIPMAQTKQKKGWREIPIVLRAGIVVGGIWGLYNLYKGSKEESHCLDKYKKPRNPNNLRDRYNEYRDIYANALYTSMSGGNFSDTAFGTVQDMLDIFGAGDAIEDSTRQKMWDILPMLNNDELRDLHNYWINNISHQCATLYDWISGEIATYHEQPSKDTALAVLSAAGVAQ